jgi:cobalt-precorrin 5A hydrolase/precorrin-3B C17-methyltransferase
VGPDTVTHETGSEGGFRDPGAGVESHAPPLPRVVAVSVTEAGRSLAGRLPFEQVHGDAGATVRGRWGEVDGFVLLLATGAAVRIVGPLLGDKRADPAVVCVDEAGRFSVALCGGHAGGGNDLARRVASLLGAQAVVTTATDAVGRAGLDTLPGFRADGDVAAVSVALLDGSPVAVENPRDWPLPAALAGAGAGDAGLPTGTSGADPRVIVTDAVVAPRRGQLVLHPPSLVVGVGTSLGAPAGELAGLVAGALADAGLSADSVAEVATIDRRCREPAVLALAWPVRTFSARQLAAVTVPNPSAAVAAAVGTPSVAEAAALLAAGPGAELAVAKRAGATTTVAVARRRRPRGRLTVVGLGPGSPRHRTPAADQAVRTAETVIGYGPYVDKCADLIGLHHEVVRSPIGDEVARARLALARAAAGQAVALVCSGDAGVYAMATVVLELAPAEAPDVDIEVVPGVTAALAAAALLGAPLGHDHASISLSDLLTPWDVIASRLEASAGADLVVSLYNPRSRGRPWQLEAAIAILARHRPPTTPVGVVTDAGRPGQAVTISTVEGFDPEVVGMTTVVVVGSSTTTLVGGRMVTPRGYKP